MAIQQIESLAAGSSRLEFRYESPLMYALVLDHEGEETFLGGDQVIIILARLLAFLEGVSSSEPIKHSDGLLWKWILTTGVPHHFIFGRKDENGVQIKLRDPVALRNVAQLSLTPDEAERWRKQLTNWRLQVEQLGDNAFV